MSNTNNKDKELFNTGVVRKFAEIVSKNNLTEIEYSVGDVKLTVRRDAPTMSGAGVSMPMASAPAVAQPQTSPLAPVVVDPSDEVLENHPGAIHSPMVGVAYLSSDPDTPDFVKVGDSVEKGQTICLIEAMKVFNPIVAPNNGTVTKIAIESGSPLEFDQVIMIIE